MKQTVLEKVSAQMCTGCEACVTACPCNAITMNPDSLGFMHPSIQSAKCIHCGLCLQNCPVYTAPKKIKPILCESYAGYSLDEVMVQRSSSGGYFGLLASYFLKHGQAVVGVQWSSDFSATEHVLYDSVDGLEKILGSKYIQSRKDHIYEESIQYLRQGKKVLFCGCPCEVAAMMNLCPAELKNGLFLVDFVCQGPTTPKAMKEYARYMEEKKQSRITSINMRHAIGPWIPQYIRISFENKSHFLERLYQTPIGDSIRILQREACYQCRFAGDQHVSDITLGDYHGAKVSDDCYHESGTSIMLVNTEKGHTLLDVVRMSGACCQSVPYADLVVYNPRMEKAWEPKAEYEVFRKTMREDGLLAASNSVLEKKQILLRKIPVHLRETLFAIKKSIKCFVTKR